MNARVFNFDTEVSRLSDDDLIPVTVRAEYRPGWRSSVGFDRFAEPDEDPEVAILAVEGPDGSELLHMLDGAALDALLDEAWERYE